jgi:hypothetical protein
LYLLYFSTLNAYTWFISAEYRKPTFAQAAVQWGHWMLLAPLPFLGGHDPFVVASMALAFAVVTYVLVRGIVTLVDRTRSA